MGGFHPFDVTPTHLAITLAGGFIVLFGMFSLFLREKLYIGEACWAFLFGVVIGPYGANLFNPRGWVHDESPLVDPENLQIITLEITRIVLAIGVFAIGVELPKAYMKRHWKSLFFLLGPIMIWGWFVSAGLIFALIPGLNFLSSLAVAACLTPTDPILAAAVIGGKYADKHVPAHLLLAAESGCNDGAAFPFLFIAIYLILEKSDAHAVQDWFLITVLYEVVLGVVFGSILGYGFRHLMRFCESKDLIDRKSYVAQYVALALFSVGATTLLGSDDLLSAFASGTAFAWDGFFNKQTEDSAFSSVIDLLFNIAAFIYIGAWMPFHLFQSEVLTLSVWRLIVLAILVLILRRLPVMLMLYKWVPDVKTFREAVFSGHFGPIGVGAIFISTLAVGELPHAHDPPQNQVELLAASIQPIVAFMVLCSITVHGLSIPFFSLGRRVHSVSRTWSRHQSTDLALGPEWMAGTRRVARAEDVVINRDGDGEEGDITDQHIRGEEDVMERGEIIHEKRPESSHETEHEKEKVQEERQLRGHEHAPEEASPLDENPPDGDRLPGDETEWREGPDLVIERDQGAGNEVEVEVIRNAFNPSSPSTRHTFQGTRDEISQGVHKYIQKARHGAGEMVEKAEETEHALKKVVSPRQRERQRRSQEEERRNEEVEATEREEDWADEEEDDGDGDNEGGLESSYSSGAALMGKHKPKSYHDDEHEPEAGPSSSAGSSPTEPPATTSSRSQASPTRSKAPKSTSHKGGARARASTKRRSLLPSVRSAARRSSRAETNDSSPSPTDADADVDASESSEHRRGRTTLPRLSVPHAHRDAPNPPSSTPTSPTSSVRARRGHHAPHDSLSRLRMEMQQERERAASPARSIRFADEERPPSRAGDVSERDDASPRVMFDVPEGKRR